MSPQRTYGIVALSLLGLTGPATAQAAGAGRSCAILDRPKTLPAVDKLVDSTAIAAAAAPMLAAGRRVDMVASLRLGRSGVDSVWLLRATPEGQPADSLLAAVRTASRPTTNVDLVGVRLRLTIDSDLRLATEHGELCKPTPIGEATSTVTVRVSVPAGSPPPSLGSARIRLRIGADGRVRSVSIISSSGNRELDDGIRRAAQQSRYLPALLDGQAVEVWMEGDRVDLVRP